MSKYVDAALQALEGVPGGGPISSRTLIDTIVAMGLLENREYLYHNVLKKIRDSDLFDTSKRGFVSLASVVEATVSEETTETPTGTEEAFEVADEVTSTESLAGPGTGPIA